MIGFFKKYNIYIFIAIVGILTIYDFLNWNNLSLVRKLVNLFAVLAILHEIEEKHWPGGFHEIMLKKMKVDINDFDVGRANLIVTSGSPTALSPPRPFVLCLRRPRS